jgi:hypothetical protein
MKVEQIVKGARLRLCNTPRLCREDISDFARFAAFCVKQNKFAFSDTPRDAGQEGPIVALAFGKRTRRDHSMDFSRAHQHL